MDLIDRILRAGAMLNPFAPLGTLIKDATNSGHIFYIAAYDGYSVNDVRSILQNRSITTWGAKFMDDYITITVSEHQANHARYVLQQSGLKILKG